MARGNRLRMPMTDGVLFFFRRLARGSGFRLPFPHLLLLVLFAGMAGCASEAPPPPAIAFQNAPPPAQAQSGYVGGRVMLECAPFARSVSGVRLYGDAGDWWWKAVGHYTRTGAPVVGSVLVFRRTERLPDGHAAVVSRLVSPREILVSQANWVPHRVTSDMPVIDVSPANDWTLVRVWWPPSGRMGLRQYPTWGFIVPERPASYDLLQAAMMNAVRVAANE